jgi:hypothetical protein
MHVKNSSVFGFKVMLKDLDSIVSSTSVRIDRIGWMVGLWALRTKAYEANRLRREETGLQLG